MREIVHIQIGNAGNAAGMEFWEVICNEHGIDACGCYTGSDLRQLEKIHVYFDQNRRKQFVPRAILVDLDVESVEDAFISKFGRIFRTHNFHRGHGSTKNNFAKGFYTEGRILAQKVLDNARKEAERCDCFQGFQIVHSIAGGTGSGLGSLILTKIADEYPNRQMSTFTILPSPNIFDDRTQIYNTVIALHHLTEMNIESYCFDNKALEFIGENSLRVPKAAYEDINDLISKSMSGITTNFRLPGRTNEYLVTSSVNMIPFPRLHYLTPGLAPIRSKEQALLQPVTVVQVSKELFQLENMFIYPPSEGKYMTANYIYRGDICPKEAKSCTLNLLRKNSNRYVDWLPDNVKTEICPVPLDSMARAGAVVGNTTAISVVFKRLLDLFDAIHENKHYIRWFTDEGVTEDELDAAGRNLHELVEEYQKCQDAWKDEIWNEDCLDWQEVV